MDLDVVRRANGHIWIDDDGEFADAVLAALRQESEPFGTNC